MATARGNSRLRNGCDGHGLWSVLDRCEVRIGLTTGVANLSINLDKPKSLIYPMNDFVSIVLL